MSERGFAYFVKHPRRIEDLMRPHLLEQEREYEVVKTITLTAIDFENFITDMVADRHFLEDNNSLCSKTEGVIRCLSVTNRGAHGSILVVPSAAWVDIAAFLPS